MSELNLHMLNARQQFEGLHDWVSDRLQSGFNASHRLLPMKSTDVVVQVSKNVIPEKGHLGYTPEAGLIFVSVDPGNPALRANSHHSLERMMAHELHHSARWEGPGYGETLGAALVTKGLACHFAQEVYGRPSEPWESLPDSTLRPYLEAARSQWDSPNYNHAEWFLGAGNIPRWLGYTLGFHIVGQYLHSNPQETAASLVNVEAGVFRPALEMLSPCPGTRHGESHSGA